MMPLNGITITEYGGAGLLGVDIAAVKTFDQVLIGNDAILYGYPVSLGVPEHPQFDLYRPLLRKALIAGEDPQRRAIIIDGPVYRGNSGGPVFQIEPEGLGFSYNLIGIATEFIPLAEGTLDFHVVFNSGYSVVEPADFFLELIK